MMPDSTESRNKKAELGLVQPQMRTHVSHSVLTEHL